VELEEPWELAASPPGACAGPGELSALRWRPARVPGTAAGSIGADGRDFDSEDWWFRTRFTTSGPAAGEQVWLELDGIATLSEVYLNGHRVLTSTSMWADHSIEVTDLLRAENTLVIACRALAPALRVRRRPGARWRTRVVNDGALRWHRTMIFGRSPGFAPGPAAVGPWRPIRLVRRVGAWLGSISVRPRLEGSDGHLQLRTQVHGPAQSVQAQVAGHQLTLSPAGDDWFAGEVHLPGVEPWWPHTHGRPALHELTVQIDGERAVTRQVGFRSLAWAPDVREAGLDLEVNGVGVFARGAVWTPADLISLAPSPSELRSVLERVRDGGMNMLRVVGTGAYESPAFHDLCDELGILVWQDMMFANLDYPVEDPEFRAEVEREARQILGALAGRPSLAVICGNSEVEQQAAMLGLDPALGRSDLWDDTLPQIAAQLGVDAAYVPSTPCGGDLPFHSDRGLAHYFGVSGYFRPVDDARRANVRFAAECLAFANIPDRVDFPVHHPLSKIGVARDAGSGWDQGAGWDFDDVRDFYLSELFGVDPVQLRRADHAHYLELSRAASGEVMAEVMGEWRRAGSSCRGALVLWLKDMLPGAGLGVLDHNGEPKVAYHHLRRALAPVSVWTTDEGVNGVSIHLANDRAEPLQARLRLALYRNLETSVAEAHEDLELRPHSTARRTVEGLLGRFADAAWAFRFGPPAHDAIVVALESLDTPALLLSQAVRFPAGRPAVREPAAQLGLEAWTGPQAGGGVTLTVRSRRLAYGVRVEVAGFSPADDAFTLEPGRERRVQLRRLPAQPSPGAGTGTLTALNLDGAVSVQERE
jgi:beta-mannosidase